MFNCERYVHALLLQPVRPPALWRHFFSSDSSPDRGPPVNRSTLPKICFILSNWFSAGDEHTSVLFQRHVQKVFRCTWILYRQCLLFLRNPLAMVTPPSSRNALWCSINVFKTVFSFKGAIRCIFYLLYSTVVRIERLSWKIVMKHACWVVWEDGKTQGQGNLFCVIVSLSVLHNPYI